MKWFPPLVELSRAAARSVPPLFAVEVVFVATGLLVVTGCSALPVMQSTPVQVAMGDDASGRNDYSDAEKLRRSQLPTIPDFDAAVSPKVAASHAVNITPAIAGSGQIGVEPAQIPSPTQLPMLRLDAPKPFAWTPIGNTTGNRSFQAVTIGDEGYRVLVIGSVAGNDPVAIELVDQLARHLHSGKTILGGFQSTVIRTLNPDGEAQQKILNEKGQYINHGFPRDHGIADANQPVEVTFLLNQIQTLQPQRLIHIRTIESPQGVIAASSGCQRVAQDVADWLRFRVINLPETAVSGSLERHLASSGRCEVLTFAIPATTKKNELWDRYGDSLQNLLMGDDVATRELARQKAEQSSASIRDNGRK
jgi:hypothetical protein